MTTDVQLAGSSARRPVLDAAARFGAGVAGSAVLGALGGLLWGEVAPRALLQQLAAGEATIVNAETRAFIVADVWFCGIAVVAGLITGIIGYRFLISRVGSDAGERGIYLRRTAAAVGLILGAVAGALIMMWIGGLIGLSSYQHALATSHPGATFESSLSLGAKSALAFWPLVTSMMVLVAEWSARRDGLPAEESPAAAPGPFGYPQSTPPRP